MLRRGTAEFTNRIQGGYSAPWGSRHGVCPNHLVYDQAVRGNDWHLDRCRGAGTPRPSDGKHQMHGLRPGAFNQDRLFETRCGALRSGRVNALPTPSTTTARRALRSCGAPGRGPCPLAHAVVSQFEFLSASAAESEIIQTKPGEAVEGKPERHSEECDYRSRFATHPSVGREEPNA